METAEETIVMDGLQRAETLDELGRELSDRLASARPTSAMNYVANFTQLQTLLDHLEQVSIRLEAWQEGRRPATIELLEHALETDPELWFAHLVLAYYDATYFDDVRAGGERLAAAARLPSAPVYVAGLARRMLECAGVEADAVVRPEIEPLRPDQKLRALEQRRRDELASGRQHFLSRVGSWVPEDFEAPEIEG